MIMPRIKPKRLRPGDTIGVIAPASPGEMECTLSGIKNLENSGFKIRLGRTIEEKLGYLSGADALRAADLHDMFADPAIHGIVCLRGGYGTMRFLEQLDYSLIKANPKVFVGYSDITALHTSIGQNTGLVTFHGPMAASDMSKDVSSYTWDCFYAAITSAQPLGKIINPPALPAPQCIVPGKARGYLTGGNLSLITATLGTPYEIDTRNKILCLEDIGEAPYRIDRMLTQLLLAGKLQTAAGLVLDVFADCDQEARQPSFSVEEVLYDRLQGLKLPILSKVYFGHTRDKATLPFGIMASLDSAAGNLEVLETATVEREKEKTWIRQL